MRRGQPLDLVGPIRQPVRERPHRPHQLVGVVRALLGHRHELIRQAPRALRGPGSASAELAELTGTEASACYSVLRQYLMKGSDLHRAENSRFPIFAFRLHQFFTRADTVWATLEREDVRYLDLSKQGAKPGEPEKTLFFDNGIRDSPCRYY